MDRPTTPVFIPKPSGVDAITHIEKGELFDFDLEVAPLLEVLVGKTLETALMEVMQEAELAAMRARQAEFEAVRNAELAEVQRLEAEVRRRAAEKRRRLEQERARVQREVTVQRKVAAAAFARSYLVALRKNTVAGLRAQGYFYDPRRREVQDLVLPDLYAGLAAAVDIRETAARAFADEVVVAALGRGQQLFDEYTAMRALQAEEQRRMAEEDAAEQARVAAEKAAKAAAEAAAAASEEGGEEAEEE